MTQPALHGLVAEYKTPTELVKATRRAHDAGYRCLDAYSPYPIEEVCEAMGVHHNRMPLIILIGGIIGCISGYSLQYWVSAVDYPLNIGGRPFNLSLIHI